MAFILRELYSDEKVQNQAQRDHVAYAMCRKKGGFAGDYMVYSLKTGNPQGVAGTFADARAGAASSKGKKLTMYRRPKFGYITLGGEAVAACDGNKGSFLELVTTETDGVLEELGDSLGFDFYRDGSGLRGQRSSLSSDTITLTAAYDARNFKEGMTIVAATDAAGTSLRTGSAVVESVDEDAGTVTVDSAAGISSFSNSDYLFRKGDPGTCMEGLSALFPLTAPGSGDSFRGINRSVGNVRLNAGNRLNDTAMPPHEAIGLLATRIASTSRRGVGSKAALVNPLVFYNITRRLDAKVTTDGGSMKASVGFEGIDVHTSAGTVRCVSDPDAPLDLGYVNDFSDLTIRHLRPLPHIIMDDGIRSLRITDEDGLEARARGWCNLKADRPGSHGVFAIAT